LFFKPTALEMSWFFLQHVACKQVQNSFVKALGTHRNLKLHRDFTNVFAGNNSAAFLKNLKKHFSTKGTTSWKKES